MTGKATLDVVETIATITISNEGRLNAIDLQMAKDLARLSMEISQRSDIHVVLVRGEGERAFCAGMDLKHAQSTGNLRQAFFEIDQHLDQAAAHFKKMSIPVICKLRGICYGAGLTLASWAHLRLASDDLKLAVPAIANKLYYPIPAMQRFAEIIGLQRVQQLLLDGHPIPNARLLEWGLIDQLHPSANFDANVAEFVVRLAGRSRDVTRDYMQIFSKLRDQDTEEAKAIRIRGLDTLDRA